MNSDASVDVLLRGYYGAARALFRKSTGLWMPYGGLSLGVGYIKISDDRAGSGMNTSVLGGPRDGRGNFGGLVRAYTGSQFPYNKILLDVQLMIFQHLNGQSFQVEGRTTLRTTYQGSWDKIKGAVLMVGVAWQN